MPPLPSPSGRPGRPAGLRRSALLWVLLGLILSLGLADSRSTRDRALASPAEEFTHYFPIVFAPPPLMANPSFEDGTQINTVDWPWPYCRFDENDPKQYTDNRGNQRPPGWTYRAYETGEVMPFPTKMQEGNVVPAVSDGVGENIHKCLWQLPTDEHPWHERAVLLDGYWTYKAFSDHLAWALKLSQVIYGRPGMTVTVTGFVLGETHDLPKDGNAKLEDDHFVASLQLGAAVDTRTYATMINNFEVPGKTRPWNRFKVTAQIPASGELPLTLILQVNWPGQTDFFVDHFAIDYGTDTSSLSGAPDYGSWFGVEPLESLPTLKIP